MSLIGQAIKSFIIFNFSSPEQNFRKSFFHECDINVMVFFSRNIHLFAIEKSDAGLTLKFLRLI